MMAEDAREGEEKEAEVIFAWSGGKDSALALYTLLAEGQYRPAVLLTTVTADYERVSMHGVRRELLWAQTASLGIPLKEIFISAKADNREYEERMRKALVAFRRQGFRKAAFGDIFLEDLRRYREENLARVEMSALFPLWGQSSAELAQRFLHLGFKAVITCVDTEKLDASFCGREYDELFLRDLPPAVDLAGENGEFHSFVYVGPLFKWRVNFRRGEMVLREGRFCFLDLLAV